MRHFARPLPTFALLAALFQPGFAGAMADPTIRGQAQLDVELQKTLTPNATLFVIARKVGQVAGPPLAVKRYAPPLKFPVDFAIAPSDVMMPGAELSGNVSLSARVSQSGNAMPAQAGDIEGFPKAKFVPVGTRKVEIKLDQVRR